MIDERNYPWPAGTIAGVQEYARERYRIELPEDCARIICERLIAGSSTVDEGIAAYLWATTGQKLMERIRELWQAFAEQLREVTESLVRVFHQYSVLSRRVELYERLPSWLPESMRDWLSAYCPERWLPELRITQEEMG